MWGWGRWPNRNRSRRLWRPPWQVNGSNRAIALFELDGPIRVVEERFPRLVLVAAQLDGNQGAGSRLDRLANQRQMRLFGGSAAFLDVAVNAGANDVVPGRLAP